MRNWRLCGLLLLGIPALAWSADAEPTFENALKQLEEAAAVLAKVKDADSAKAARPKFDKIIKQFEQSREELKKAFKEKKAEKKDMERIEKAGKAVEKEMARIDTNPKTYPAFRDNGLFQERRRGQERLARIGAETLSVQVETYKLNNANYPDKIEALTKPQPNGGLAMVPPEKIKDPWGQPYKIDPAGPKNKGRKCDVWSVGHPIEKRILGNWTDKEKK